MIRETKGDILKTKEGIIAVLTNEFGTMEHGLARQIREKLMTEAAYRDMERKFLLDVAEYGVPALKGRYFLCDNPAFRKQYFPCDNLDDCKPVIAPVVARCGKDRISQSALRKALTGLKDVAEQHGWSISIPGYLGCGESTSDWDEIWDEIYTDVLIPLFAKDPVQLNIIYNEDSAKRLMNDFKVSPHARHKLTGDLIILRDWHGFPFGTRWDTIVNWLQKTFVHESGGPEAEHPEERWHKITPGELDGLFRCIQYSLEHGVGYHFDHDYGTDTAIFSVDDLNERRLFVMRLKEIDPWNSFN